MLAHVAEKLKQLKLIADLPNGQKLKRQTYADVEPLHRLITNGKSHKLLIKQQKANSISCAIATSDVISQVRIKHTLKDSQLRYSM